ncbi:MAG: tetrathionate reductase family octaheme c-type cytochrome [Candidatus Binatia bacterium]|jgi:octaheme c-type cytochrome (tetrathionate reductase family)
MHNDRPHRVTKPLFTFGTLTLLIIMGIGFSFGITRLLLGLGTVTNLDNYSPWGIWISFDVACGVALAAGGFTTAALVDIFGRRKYRPLLRPAILTAFLGYLWVAIALSFDLGRYWNIWRPIFNWQGNSVLFEVGMCVTFYLIVLGVEMSPSVLEGLKARLDHGEWGAKVLLKVEKPLLGLYAVVSIILPLFIVMGVVLSFMHQSSLGTLMLIAPTKLSTLWNTPILPVLFLLSAIMVGFPMVILESIYANISFGRNPEMDLLTPLAKIIPWFLAAYGTVKIGDLIVRHSQLDFLSHPAATISLVIEILLGVVAPFLLFLNPAVRRSMGWLFFTVSLIICGVIMNRINVFLVGYNPPYATKAYFPSVGEIAMTMAIVSSILFCYRFFVTFFPILPGYLPATEVELARIREEREKTVNPFWTWVIRGAAVACLLSFVVLYSLVHIQAMQASLTTVQGIERVKVALPVAADAVEAPSYPQRPAAYKNFYLLDSPLLNSKSDDYEPVGFSHRIHDELVGGDCGVCHHRYATSENDRVGEDIKEFHASNDVKLGGPCSSCHDNMEQNAPQSCSRCHGLPDEPDDPARIGLKGAYHRQCIGCHERQLKPASAPTACAACHHPWTPDHSTLVTLRDKPSPKEVTRSCLSCHPKVGQDLLNTAHWNWKGYSPTLKGYEHRIDISLTLMVNNACIAIGPNLQECASCHIGYGWVDSSYNFSDPGNIDCLVCHDTTGLYRKDIGKGGLPDPALNLAEIARRVGRPSRRACGSCHFVSGGTPYTKHGDLEAALADPSPGLDQHMGTLEMRCQDCHTTTAHRIAGMSMSAPAVEGRVSCEKCHGPTPHGVAGMLSRHLDDHIRSVACETCHIPSIARAAPTLLRRDYSQAGQDRAVTLDKYGMPQYDKKFGTLTWGKDLVPAYLWYDGTRNASLVGDKIDASDIVILNAPVGEKRNPAARIFPFQTHAAVQPYDMGNSILAVPKLLDDFWKNFNWSTAIDEGMKRAGVPYSGQYDFVETRMYSSIHHEVVPAKQALGCSDCHSSEAITCTRCHKNAAGMDLPEHRRAVYPDVKNRIDFKALGYPDDPALVGGRFYIAFGRGTPPQ